jgi:hypothetical protein
MPSNANRRPLWLRIARSLAVAVAGLLAGLLTLWSVAALWFDVRRGAWARYSALAVYVLLLVAIRLFVGRRWLRVVAWAACFLAVLVWWLSLQPSNDREWQPDVARTAWAEVHGDEVVIHDVRNCDYRSEFDYICAWETREYDLRQLRGADGYIVYWGSPWIAHTIVSFQFGDRTFIAFSIETRWYNHFNVFIGKGPERYMIAQYERDVIRLRTNYRKDEDVYLYRLAATTERERQRFLEYIARLNELHEHPEWYNALTRNCTTSIFAQRTISDSSLPLVDARNWRVLLNGKLDEMLYRAGAFAGNLEFEQLRQRAYINRAARVANQDPDFSLRIREGRPGFESSAPVLAPR